LTIYDVSIGLADNKKRLHDLVARRPLALAK
jgi:hypothetical protein